MCRAYREKTSLTPNFNAIGIGLISPERILEFSMGEVTKAETFNFRTLKPEYDGLFCAKIFGPVVDLQCLCGKYKGRKHENVVCERCGVTVTTSSVRRERFGHIKLASPCSHIWFLKGPPSYIGCLLDISARDLEKVIYFKSYITTSVRGKKIKLEEKMLLTEEQYRELLENYPGKFTAKMGAEAIKELLQKADVNKLAAQLRDMIREDGKLSRQEKLKYSKRLKVIQAFQSSDMASLKAKRKNWCVERNCPEWMILDIIPVLPPDLRPIVPLEDGSFAISDLNNLYRRIIDRNNRLLKLIELGASDVTLRHEKRMLQEAVDALIDNGRREPIVTDAKNRPLNSLSTSLKGKYGRFRQNLLGKRVDYSGRSVIVVGPELKLHQCGLPKVMAFELFKPFIYGQLFKRGIKLKDAKDIVEWQQPLAWYILEDLVRDYPVLLNRAPTLHRLGVQAFEPVLIESKAIKLHPLVCTGFNADFDGDQMGVHVPISPEAQLEASVLLLASNNILSPANGQPITIPTQDIVLGCYYLTKANVSDEKANASDEFEGHMFSSTEQGFSSTEQVLLVHEGGRLHTQTPIKLLFSGDLIDLERERDDQDLVWASVRKIDNRLIDTTVGRVIFNEQMPPGIPFINGTLKKKGLQSLVKYCLNRLGREETLRMLDRIKELGFLYATKAGISIGIDDLITPPNKADLLERAQNAVLEVERNHNDRVITSKERFDEIISIWSKTTERVAEAMFAEMSRREAESGELNPILIMADSGARGSKQQLRQLAGMRGLMARPSGEIIETPVRANLREGLGILEYFISIHGARKGLADMALRTGITGYLTRRLVDVAQDVVVSEYDCGGLKGIQMRIDGSDEIESLRNRIIGRVAFEEVRDPVSGEVLVKANEEITEDLAARILRGGRIKAVTIRSVLACKSRRGVCAKCYGSDLSTGRLVEVGEAVGIIAAQSISEPGTQLTMRTFHGAHEVTRDITTDGLPRVIDLFEAARPDNSAVMAEIDGKVSFGRKSRGKRCIIIAAPDGQRRECFIPRGVHVKVCRGDSVKAGDLLTDGQINPQDILSVLGVEELQRYLIDEIQEVYRLQGVIINDKHIEVIIRKMLRWVCIKEIGDTEFLPEEIVTRFRFEDENRRILEKGGRPAQAEPLLLGIRKASLLTESFISAASFQETVRVLTDAAVSRRVDYLRGLKENVILGRLIPAGTGMWLHRNIKISPDNEPRRSRRSRRDKK